MTIRWYRGPELVNGRFPTPEVLADHPIVVPSQSRVILYGAPGCTKTWAALNCAIQAAADGRPTVLLLGEGNEHAIQARVAELCWTGRYDPQIVAQNLIFGFGPCEIATPVGLLEVGWLSGYPADLVVVDNLFTYASGDENVVHHMRPLLSLFDLWVGQNISVLLLHHARKSGETTTPDLRGSSVLRQWADVIYSFARPKHGTGPVTICREKGRDIAEEATEQRFAFGRNEDGKLGWWPEGQSGVRAQGSQVSLLDDLVCEVLRSGPATLTAIAKSLGRSNGSTRGAIERLQGYGLVVCQGEGRGVHYALRWDQPR